MEVGPSSWGRGNALGEEGLGGGHCVRMRKIAISLWAWPGGLEKYSERKEET